MGPCKILQALPVGVVETPSSKQRGRRQSIGGMSQGCKFSWTLLGTSFFPPEVYSTEITMVRLVPGLPAPLRHPGFSIPWQYWGQFGETWLGNVWPLGSPDRAILSPAGKTMAAQKHENTNLLAGGIVCPKVSRIAHQFKTRSQAMSPQLGS